MDRDAAQFDARPSGALPVGYGRGEGGRVRPVWVALSSIYRGAAESAEDDGGRVPVESASAAPVPAGQQGRLDLRSEVLGWLHHWERDLEGRWFGLVDYSVPLVGDLRPAARVSCGLVPAAALRPRELAALDGQPRHAP